MAQEDVDPESNSNSLMQNTRCCFCFPRLGSRGSYNVGESLWERIRSSRGDRGWWTRAFLKIREWSELVAGPRWKTFIRRFNRDHRHRGGQFQYDPLSYAMNFDEGPGQNGESDSDGSYGGFRSFSKRYASVPASVTAPLREARGKSLEVGA